MNTFWENYAGKVLFLLTSTLVAGVIAYFQRKKVSTDAISRKDDVYQPLIDELGALSTKELDLFERVSIPFSVEVFENNYKFAVDENILQKLQVLIDLILIYNDIDMINIAHNILVDHFAECFESLYGSVIEGRSYHSNEFGEEHYEEEEAEEFKAVKQGQFAKELKSLILKENMPDHTIRLSDNYYDYIYGDIVRIYALSIDLTINGKPIPKRKTPSDWCGTIPEYFAYTCQFFEQFNANPEVINKYKLRNEIVELGQGITQELKELVESIVRKYEKEIL